MTEDPHGTNVNVGEWTGLFPEVVETDRLVLHRLSPRNVDLRAFYEVCAHDDAIDDVTEHLAWDPHPHPQSTREFVAAMDEAWAEGEAATYLLHPKAADTFAGGCGLTLDWDRRSCELGLWLRRRFWGRGYSGERAAALLALAFDHLDLELVTVTHETGNENSRRAVEKYVDHFGGHEEALVRNAVATDDGPRDVRRYSIAREEYRAAVE